LPKTAIPGSNGKEPFSKVNILVDKYCNTDSDFKKLNEGVKTV
jgi:hypothetical protein